MTEKYQNLILKGIERIETELREVRQALDTQRTYAVTEITQLKVELAALKAKASAYGGIAGLVVGILMKFVLNA